MTASSGPSRADVELEDQFLVLRAAIEAERVLVDGDIPARGGIAIFPVAVFAQSKTWGKVKAGSRSWAFHVSHEPGSVFPVGVTEVTYHGDIAKTGVKGKFHVIVGRPPAGVPDATYRVQGVKRGEQPPEWVAELPQNVYVPSLPASRLRVELRRVARRGGDAMNRIFELSSHTVSFATGRYKRVMYKNQQWADPDDILQACWERHVPRMRRFASDDRPLGTTWRHWLYTATVRDAQRELRKNPYGVSEVVSQIVSWMADHPEVTDPEGIHEGMTFQSELRRLQRENPGVSIDLLEPQVDISKAKPPVSLRQVESAIAAVPLLVVGGRVSEVTMDDEPAGNREIDSLTATVPLHPDQEAAASDAASRLLDAVRAVLDQPDDATAFLDNNPATVSAARRRLLSVVRQPEESLNDPAVINRLRSVLLDEHGEPRSPDEVRWVLWQQANDNGKMF